MMRAAGAMGAPVGFMGGFAPGRVEVAGLFALCGGMGMGHLVGGGVCGSIAVDVFDALESTKKNVEDKNAKQDISTMMTDHETPACVRACVRVYINTTVTLSVHVSFMHTQR